METLVQHSVCQFWVAERNPSTEDELRSAEQVVNNIQAFDLEEIEVCQKKLDACWASFNQFAQMPIYHISYQGISANIYISLLSHILFMYT